VPAGGALLGAFLYDVAPLDLGTMLGPPLVLVAATALASLGPARAATRSDPARALRDD